MARKRFKSFRQKKEALDLDITSLLDILVILLVFLLKSYNASDLTLDLAKGIELAGSKSETLGAFAVIIQVNQKKEVFINNKKVGNMSDRAGEKITPLFNRLVEIKKEEEAKIADPKNKNPRKKEDLSKVNIVMDKKLQYQDLRRIMHTAALAGHGNFKFIVKGNY